MAAYAPIRSGRRAMIFAATLLVTFFGLVMAPLFASGTTGAVVHGRMRFSQR